MPLAVKWLTLGGGEGVKYVPGCVLTVGGVASLGEITDLLFIHYMNRGSAFPPLTGPGAVCLHTLLPVPALTSDRMCPAGAIAAGTRDCSLQSGDQELCV